MFEVDVHERQHLDTAPDYGAEVVQGHPLDSEAAVDTFNRLMGFWHHEIDRQAEARAQMALDEAFYDGDQWSEEHIAELEARGQVPLVFNVIHTTTNWVLGTERRMKIDHHILPRRKDGAQHAKTKTELYKHVTDANHSHQAYSRAFSEAVRGGLSFLETGYRSDSDMEPVYDRMESWRNIVWDSTSTEPDMSDARYIMRAKWMDTDYLVAKFPDRRAIIESAVSVAYDSLMGLDGSGDFPMDAREEAYQQSGYRDRAHSMSRPRVRAYEMWFRKYTEVETMKGGQFHGELYDPWSLGHVMSVNSGMASVVAKPKDVIHVAIATDAGLLYLDRSPYRHNRFPFTPIWGNRRADDGMPYGLIRQIRDIQTDLNKRASKSLHILSTKRSFVEEGSVEDIEEFRDEAARPDPVFVYKAGMQPPKVETDFAVASGHMELMSRDVEMIQQVGGVTDENLGRRTNATSGIAIERRQTQGQLATGHFFENFAYARHLHGEKILANIEQFYTEAHEFRITNQRGNPEYVAINDPANPESQITLTKADFIIGEYDWQASYRQAQAEAMFDLAQKLAATAPQAVMAILDLLVELMDVPNGDEIVKRIRQMTGVDDPDADPNNPDPETVARQKAKEAEAAFAQAMAKAELAEKEGKALKLGAEARKVAAEAAKAEARDVSSVIADLQAAITAATNIFGNEGVARVADRILAEAEARAGGGAMPDVAASAGPAGATPVQPPGQPPVQPPAPAPLPA